MKRIYFIRHSKAQKDTQNDFDRNLSQRGKDDAKFMGKRLKKYGVKPSLILSSSAKRAIKTASLIAKEVGYNRDIKSIKSLYNASNEAVFAIISSLAQEIENLFLIGHNPSLTQVCEILSDSSIGNIPTSGIFCIEFDNFENIQISKAKVLFFDYPKKH